MIFLKVNYLILIKMANKYIARQQTDQDKKRKQPVNKMILPTFHKTVLSPKAKYDGYRMGSPTNFDAKPFMFTSHVDSIQSQYLGSQSFSRKNQLFRDTSKGLSIVEVESGLGLINHSQNDFNRLLLNRLKRQVRTLKEVNRDLLLYVEDQKINFTELYSRLIRQLSGRLQLFEQKGKQKNEAHASLMYSSYQSVEIDLKQKAIENEQLLKEIQILKLSRVESFQKKDGFLEGCSNCKILEIKLSSLKEELNTSGKQQSKIQAENERLNQVIFDLEQQVIGIEWQVEKKVKETLQKIPEIAGNQMKVNNNVVESLMKDLDRAETRCKHYQSLCKTEQELSIKQQQINQLIAEYQLKNSSLFQSIARNEENINRNYQKQHQLLLAQEELNGKIQALRSKEIQLSQWQASLTNRKNTQAHHINTQYIQNQKTPRMEQISMKNLEVDLPVTSQRHNQDYYNNMDYRVTLPQRNTEIVNDRIIENIIPKLPLNDGKESRGSFQSNKQPSQFYQSRFSNHLQYNHQRNPTDGLLGRSNLMPHILTSPSNKIVGSKGKSYKMNSRPKHQYGRGSGVNREKSSSPSRSFKSSHMSHLARSNINYGGTYNAAQNKLEKLRNELKKELDAIR